MVQRAWGTPATTTLSSALPMLGSDSVANIEQMSGIWIGRAKVKTMVNVEGDLYIDRDEGLRLGQAIEQLLATDDSESARHLLHELNAKAARGDSQLSVEDVAAETERQLERDAPSRQTAERIANVAQGAAGGVISQGVVLAIRGYFGF
jgi:hypothetical protein